MLIFRKNSHNLINRIKFIFLLLVVSFVCKPNLFAQNEYKIRKVVIDAGHGGKDSGARTSKYMEKDIVLNVALQVGKYIEENIPDVQVIYTRKTDVFVELSDRARIANENHADLFISIHANSNPSKKPYGTETFAMGLHNSEENLEVAKKENAVIALEDDYSTKYEGFDPNSTESYIIFSLLQNTNLQQSLTIASYVQKQFRERASRHDRGVKQAGFLVLKDIAMPRILIELGFLSNSKEEIYLASKTGQTYLASAIYRAFKEYKEYIESKSNYSITEQEQNTIQNQTEVYFKVQILASSNQISVNEPAFSEYNEVEEFNSGMSYKYAVGHFMDYTKAQEYHATIKDKFPDSFIIAVKNNQIIPLSEAIKN